MFAAGLASSSLVTSALSQTVAGFAGRASAELKGFDADLDSGNLSGAQSFLSALQQKASAQGAAPAGSSISSEFAQVRQDLHGNDLIAARSDFATLKSDLAQMHRAGQTPGAASGQTSAGSSDSSSPLSALQSLNLMQQSAYNSALHLTLPSSVPSLSVNSW